jgi:hypothetical protein
MANRFRTAGHASRTAEYMALFRAPETAEPARRMLFEYSHAATLPTERLKRSWTPDGRAHAARQWCARA